MMSRTLEKLGFYLNMHSMFHTKTEITSGYALSVKLKKTIHINRTKNTYFSRYGSQ